MTRNIYKISSGSKLGSHIVEGKVYVNITSIAEEYGMSLNTVYKRYSRGYRGDDLVPKHKHKSYVKPINLPNYNFFVKGIGYMSKAEACRKNNINYITFRKRMEYGWSLEDALTIPTKFHYCPNNDQGSGTAKSLTLEGKEFRSISEASRHYGLSPECVQTALRSGDTIEQAFKLVGKATIHSFSYKGENYRNLRHLANVLDFPYNILSSRVHLGMSVENAINLGKEKILNVGRYNKIVLSRNSDLASKIGKLYFVSTNINGNKRYKIGITTQKIKNRLSTEFFSYKVIKLIQLPLMQCYLIEKKLLDTFSKYRDTNVKPSQLDGYREVFNFSEEVVEKVKLLIIKSYDEFK